MAWGVEQNLKKGVGDIGGLSNIGVLGNLCQLCKLSSVTCISNKIINWRLSDSFMHFVLNTFHGNGLFLCPLKTLLMYFREYKRRPVSWKGLKIFLSNMSAECWYSFLFRNRTCFLIVDLRWFFQCTQEV